jgi:hypothetical protein
MLPLRPRSAPYHIVDAGAVVHHSKIARAMTGSGQNLRLPHRNIGIRFTPISRHYASEAVQPFVALSMSSLDPSSRCRLFLVGRDHQRGLAGSPTTTKGAHRRGSASTSDFAPSIIARIDCRNASAWGSFGSRAAARNVPIINLAVASSLTLQCDTMSDFAPA